jgi:hypothetical protein
MKGAEEQEGCTIIMDRLGKDDSRNSLTIWPLTPEDIVDLS